jgi:hypothetical protein
MLQSAAPNTALCICGAAGATGDFRSHCGVGGVESSFAEYGELGAETKQPGELEPRVKGFPLRQKRDWFEMW